MLEIKNLCRTYTSKGGVVVKALDDVSVNFESTGMVFILGKSGSGKSTLLNVMGGLDKYDSGEIVIKGRSSATFSAADFDSYRNTFIGFIFQDYNILEEFTVAKNIALAMELQGKKATKEAVDAIIASVDLVGYGNRKPNTLSGGQKQRVAIARALIKEPEIIMADEPTGALDSNTGRQVFDTLKSLSKSKLVIVVSHDREFAEQYGDRIIELADGKIVSDVKKYYAPPQSAPGGITVTDNKIITVKKGQPVSPESLKIIADFIGRGDKDVIISVDEKANRDFRKAARMDEAGNKESFAVTTPESVKLQQYDGSQMKLIKSRLPFKDSFKMGASSLKHKPVRLFFTILLSAIAFGLFGLTDTLGSYNKVTTAANSIVEDGVDYASMESVERRKSGSYTYFDTKQMSEAELAGLKEKTGIDFKPVYTSLTDPDGRYTFTLDNFLGSTDDSKLNRNYHITEVRGVLEMTDDELAAAGLSLVAGAMPKNYGEIAITKFQAELFELAGFKQFDGNGRSEIVTIDTPADMVGKKISFSSYDGTGDKTFTVSAVVDTRFDEEKYASIKDIRANDSKSYRKIYAYQNYMRYHYHCLLFVRPGYRQNLLSSNSGSLFQSVKDMKYAAFLGEYNDFPNNGNNSFGLDYAAPFSDALASDIVWGKAGAKTALSDTEIVLSANVLEYMELTDENGNPVNIWDYTNIDNLTYQYAMEHFAEDRQKPGFPIDDIVYVEDYARALCGTFGPYDFSETNPYGKSGNELLREATAGLLERFLLDKTVSFLSYDYDGDQRKALHGKVVGVYIKQPNPNRSGGALIAAQSLLEKLMPASDGVYSFCIAPMPTEIAKVTQLVKLGYDDSQPYGFVLKNTVTDSLDNVNDMIETMSSAFLYVGLGFAVFAALMLMNFISTSIAYKKREIGILRAVGARGSDVFGIFFNESLIIAVINYLVAVALAIVGCILLNNLIASMGLELKILVFGIRQLALMLAVCVGVAFLASFLPTKRISMKKPIDAIQNR